MQNNTDWSWGPEHLDENQPRQNPEIRSPKPIRPEHAARPIPTMKSQQPDPERLSVSPPGTPPNSTSPWYHYVPPGAHVYTRPASPLVNGQNDRRPLTMGNPAVVGLWSFATVTILLGVYNLFLPHKPNNIILPTALLFGGIAQYIAGFLDLFYGGTFSGTILISYGAYWAGAGMMMLPSADLSLKAYATEYDVRQAHAIYHFMWCFYTLMLVVLSMKIRSGTFILTWCLFFVFLTLLLTGAYYLTEISAILRVSGVTAFLAAVGAYYSGIAAVLEEQKVKLPVGKYKWNKYG